MVLVKLRVYNCMRVVSGESLSTTFRVQHAPARAGKTSARWRGCEDGGAPPPLICHSVLSSLDGDARAGLEGSIVGGSCCC